MAVKFDAGGGGADPAPGAAPNTLLFNAPTKYTTLTDGETVKDIASRWKVDLNLFIEMNKKVYSGIGERARMKKGSQLHLPRPGQTCVSEALRESSEAGGRCS